MENANALSFLLHDNRQYCNSQGLILITWFNCYPSMDMIISKVWDEFYLSIPKLQRLHRFQSKKG